MLERICVPSDIAVLLGCSPGDGGASTADHMFLAADLMASRMRK